MEHFLQFSAAKHGNVKFHKWKEGAKQLEKLSYNPKKYSFKISLSLDISFKFFAFPSSLLKK